MKRTTRLLLTAACLACMHQAREAQAVAEVHRFNLVIAGNPGAIFAEQFNERIENYNRVVLRPRGLEPLAKIDFAWLFQGEFRYFVRPNATVNAGVGYVESINKREYLPRIGQSINIENRVESVPVHVGATYYLAPYNQGDFQARAFLGAGVLSLTNNRVVLEQKEFQTDSATSLGGSFRAEGVRDSPGYYLEVGGHMFFASRYSVMLGALYRSAMIRDVVLAVEQTNVETGETTVTSAEKFDLDLSGIAVRLAIAIGF